MSIVPSTFAEDIETRGKGGGYGAIANVQYSKQVSGESEVSPLVETDEPVFVTKWKLFLTTFCFAGVQFGWALQIGTMTPFLQEDIKLPKWAATLTWLVGPLSGLLVQPIVGVLSDNCTSRLGRRRPFIIGGAIFIAFALLLIPNSPDIGALMGDSSSSNPAAIVMAILGFALLDCSNNMLQGPCRALLVDVAHPEQQEVGNAFFSIALGIGNVAGYLAGTVTWSSLMPWLNTGHCESACGSARFAFTISVIYLACSVCVTVFSTKEKPLRRRNIDNLEETACGCSCCGSMCKVFKDIWNSVKAMPAPMIRICIVQFFSWVGWFCFLVSITDWVGQDVNGGDPHAPSGSDALEKYQYGVRMSQFGLAAYAGISLCFSPFVPRVIETFGEKTVWAISQLGMCAILCCTPFVETIDGAIFLIACFGFPWSITMTIPYALTAAVSPISDRGLFMGVLNIFVVLPEFVVAFTQGFVVDHFGHVYSGLIMGGGASFLGAISCYYLIIRKKTGTILETTHGGGLAQDVHACATDS